MNSCHDGVITCGTDNSCPEHGSVTLKFKDKDVYTVYEKDQKTDKAGKSLTLDLLPGEGVMVMLKYA